MAILGQGLREKGHEITVMANRFERDLVEPFASRIIVAPSDRAAYMDLSEFTADWLEHSWGSLFNSQTQPDVVLNGGWPFFSSIPLFRKRCKAVVFMDHGVVPREGYGEDTRRVLNKLIDLRRRTLPSCSAITSVSRFLADSQSIPESGGKAPVYLIYNGSDHLRASELAQESWSAHSGSGCALKQVESLRGQGIPTVLLLGRWEPDCYKNSRAAFGVIRSVRDVVPNACLLLLANMEECDIPRDLRSVVYPIGRPSDEELVAVMRHVDLGISVSQWEGFNLPLAEMQWLDRPALAFSLAAHPEVILDPWYLCSDTTEMSAKACDVLQGRGPAAAARGKALSQFRQRFTWARAIDQYQNMLDDLVSASTRKSISVIMDVTNSAIDPANSGVIRVTRRLGRELQKYEDPCFVRWDRENQRYVLPVPEECHQLAQFNGPVESRPERISPGYERRKELDQLLGGLRAERPWLLLTETLNEVAFRHIRFYARARGFRLAAVFHDAIPVLRPELCNDEVRNNHAAYMKGLAECDVVIPVSQYSAQCLRDFWEGQSIDGCQVTANLLPGEFFGTSRSLRPVDRDNPVHLVCVSTLEPRKNHNTLVRACLRMAEEHSAINWKLTLVGNKYAGALDIADFVEDASRRDPRIQWLGVVDDAALQRLYEEATFTVYPSVIEGFGMPILESIWHGRACICSDEGVMAELARGGGCLTVKVSDERLLSNAIARLATSKSLREKLESEAARRAVKTWDEYGQDILLALGRNAPYSGVAHGVTTDWKSFVYPHCLLDSWQMADSERLGLTGLLARLRPECSIEVGTYLGGSLSLISQYSKMAFSVDVDPAVSGRLGQLKNVSFLTGSSSALVPILLEELEAKGIAVEFILIDADHSAEGVKRDIAWLLDYIPQKPMFVVLHDSFNPECRRGMLESPWGANPYCHWVDLDFVPGRIIEHGGPGDGEMWGGLAMACFLPQARDGALLVQQTAARMFHALSELRSQSG
jgi:glycosyltransferase involved in cell wall biosynthesis